ncbi:MAG: FAD-dependent oxidoreductase [Methylococcales bacterium]|nr:FAD-dependent oxidoreductase [Methylococcales bacterium]
MRIIVIGGIAAGAKAAAKARRVDPNHEIIIYQDEDEVSYSACGLPYVISGVIDDGRKIVIRQPEDFAREGIKVFTRHRVTSIDKTRQQLTVRNLKNNFAETVDYDRLILATGAYPIVPNVEGITLEGVLTLRNISDLGRFKTLFNTMQPKRAVIIGAGYIGLELAESFHELTIKTTIVEKAARILPRFDAEMARPVHEHLLENQVELIIGDGLARLHGYNGWVTAVETECGKMIPADLVVIAIGVKPNVELAIVGGIELGKTGAIAVDSRMETRTPGIFAAGDCCETVNRMTDTPIWMPLGDIANLQGRVAGENVAGGNAHFPGVFGTAIFKTFKLTVAITLKTAVEHSKIPFALSLSKGERGFGMLTKWVNVRKPFMLRHAQHERLSHVPTAVFRITGLSEQAAQESGFEPVSIVMTGTDRARYYPGRQEFSLKLIADRQDGRLLGAQVIGCGTVDKMIDIIATALLGKLTCADMENADLAYSPPFSPVLSPINVAAGILKSKQG